MADGRIIKELLELTEMGVGNCREALDKADTIEGAINYLRSTGSEPNVHGLSDGRVDILNKNTGEVVDTFKTFKELEANVPNFYFRYRVRFVSKVGHYSYFK